MTSTSPHVPTTQTQRHCIPAWRQHCRAAGPWPAAAAGSLPDQFLLTSRRQPDRRCGTCGNGCGAGLLMQRGSQRGNLVVLPRSLPGTSEPAAVAHDLHPSSLCHSSHLPVPPCLPTPPIASPRPVLVLRQGLGRAERRSRRRHCLQQRCQQLLAACGLHLRFFAVRCSGVLS